MHTHPEGPFLDSLGLNAPIHTLDCSLSFRQAFQGRLGLRLFHDLLQPEGVHVFVHEENGGAQEFLFLQGFGE